MKYFFLFLTVVYSTIFNAQNIDISAIEFQNIGPTIMSGRVVDLAVNPDNPTEFYVAYASGGLWYTNNNGTSFDPVMDTAPTQNCGSVTVNWATNEIWVGTGEVNASRSSYAGIGLLKSSDKGKSWQNLGLTDSHHIARIWVNPKNSNEIVVAAVGHLYTSNLERGVFKTIDGGKTWNKSLYVNDTTGVIDLVVAPDNPKVMFAATWQKDRKAWNFNGNGKASGIYKSTDGGSTWQLVTIEGNGFPNNEGVGRIGLAIVNQNTIYAVLDNQNNRPKGSKGINTSNPFSWSMPGDAVLEMPNKILDTYLKKHGFREKYKAQNVKNMVSNEMNAATVKKVLQDANAALFETEVIGCEVYKSTDGGTTWQKRNADFIDDMYYTYGYYFANITVDPTDENNIYIGGVPLLISNNGGESFEMISKENVHADHHVTWVNPKNANHIINGNDGGVNISYDKGEHWIKCNNQAVSQLYAVNVDYNENYNVYGGMQDNGVWKGPGNYSHDVLWHQNGKYPYEELMGGDGMQTQIDNRNSNVVFTGYQFGNYYRIDKENEKFDYITPKNNKKEKPFRFNWQTPILLSSHNQDILYLGSNFLHRSMNQGETWEKISDDLTLGEVEGNVAFGTITTIAESKFQFGLLYVGSDDGLVHVSKDGGVTWIKITNNLPQNLWVSRVVASKHKKERVYVSLNGYRNDEFNSYVFVSEDYGATWKSISKGLTQPVNVVLEDDVNENLIFAGTDNGLFVSLNKGNEWKLFSVGMPTVAVHDLALQTKKNDLIVGTHGRSIYKTNIDKIELLTDTILEKEMHIFPLSDIKVSNNWGKKQYAWSNVKEPKVLISLYSKENLEVDLIVENELKMIVYKTRVSLKKGLNTVEYDFAIPEKTAQKWNKKVREQKIEKTENGKYYFPVGTYTLYTTQSSDEKSVFKLIKNNK